MKRLIYSTGTFAVPAGVGYSVNLKPSTSPSAQGYVVVSIPGMQILLSCQFNNVAQHNTALENLKNEVEEGLHGNAPDDTDISKLVCWAQATALPPAPR